MDSAPGVITDFDGTLADTRAANRAAYAGAFAAERARFSAAAYDAAFGLGFRDMMAAVAPDLDEDATARIATAKTRLYPRFFPLVRVNTALLAVLERLRGTGSPIALASTARRANLVPLLAALGLDHLFPVLVTAEDVTALKPAPDGYLLAARLLGRRTEDCIVFEDSAHGIRAAEAAGCLVVRVAL